MAPLIPGSAPEASMALNVDRNIQALKAVEASWSLPSLPDMVKLDLAALSGLDASSITQFAYGISGDIAASREAPQRLNSSTIEVAQTPLPSEEPPEEEEEEEPFGQWPDGRQFMRGMANLSAPIDIEGSDSIIAWKERAVRLGYLRAEDVTMDARWDPAFNSIAFAMSSDDFNRRKQGDHPGPGSSIEQIGEFFDDWLSPTGLVDAAVSLGFLWDVDRIDQQFESWGNPLEHFNNWRQTGDFKELWRTLGPIDDLLMPIVNMGLMAVGVGEVLAFSKATMAAHKMHTGYRGLRAWQVANGAARWAAIDDLGKASFAGRSGIGRALGASTDVGADVARMQRPGLLGGRKFIGETAGDAMAGWRNLRPAMIGKKTVQQGMRIGFVSRLEDRLGYKGTGLEDYAPEVVRFSAAMRHNPFVWTLGEAMLTPYNLLQPKQVGNPFAWTKKFAKVGEHSYYTDEFATAVRRQILLQGDDVAEAGMDTAGKTAHREALLKAWDRDVRAKGSSQALADRFTGSDTEKLGLWMTFTSTMAVIDAEAQTLSSMARGGKAARGADDYIRNATRFDADFLLNRNRLISEIRYIDPDDIEGLFWEMALSRAKTVREARNFFDGYMSTYQAVGATVPTTMAKHVEAHNLRRQELWADLMGRHMEPGLLADSMTDSLLRAGAWDDFVAGSDEVAMVHRAGGFDNAHYAPAFSPETGARVGARRGRILKEESIFDQSEERHWLFDFQDVVEDPDFIAHNAANGGVFSATARAFPKNGRMTVARKGTKVYQDKASEVAVIGFLEAARDAVTAIRRSSSGQAVFGRVLNRASNVKGKATSFDSISEAALGQILKEINAENVTKHGAPLLNDTEMRHIKRVQRYVKKHEIPVGTKPPEIKDEFFTPYLPEMEAHLTSRLNSIDRSGRWALDYGIDSTLPLADKAKALRRQMPFTGVEVDPSTIPADLAASLEAKGYKLVHGTEFASPHDLFDLHVEVRDLVEKGKWADQFGSVPARIMRSGEEGFVKAVRGVGRATQRFEPDYITAAYRATLRTSLHKALMGYRPAGGVGRNYSGAKSADLEYVTDLLGKVARMIGDEGTDLVKGKTDMARLSPARAWTNVRSAFIPATPADLVRAPYVWRKATKKLRQLSRLDGVELTDDELLRIFDGLKGARVVGRTIRGSIVHGKDKLQATPVVSKGLRLLGRTAVGESPDLSTATKWTAKFGSFTTRSTFTAGGGLAGRWGYDHYNPEQAREPASFQRLLTYLSAAVGGRLVGGAAVGRLFKGTGVVKGVGQSVGRLWKGDDPKYLAKTQRALQTLSSSSVMANKLDASLSMKHWTYLFDDLAALRDYFRFTLSPIFDASRYTEGAVLAQIGGVPEEVIAAGGLRYNMSPSKWKKTRARELAGGRGKRILREHTEAAGDEWDDVVDEFATIGRNRHDFDYEALEVGTARFRQIGIFGFNTQEWMASMYADLTRLHNVPPRKAYELARSAFTYGTKPRSAMEMTVNAVFFPFSFMKKTAGHAAKFLSEDWTRAAMMHDAVKGYSILNEEYDLDQLWRKHAPFLEKFQRLNPFAYGVTPGELGGADRPLIDFWNSSPMAAGTTDQAGNALLFAGQNTPIFNLFVPQAVTIKSEEEMLDYESLVRRIAPVWNDMTALYQDLQAQGHVFFGGTGITEEAEATLGFELVNQKRYELDIRLRVAGFEDGIGSIRRKAARWAQDELTEFRRETQEHLGGYRDAYFDDVVFNSIVRDEDAAVHKAVYSKWREANPTAFGGFPPEEEPELRVGFLLSYADGLLDRWDDYDAIPLDELTVFLDLAGSWADSVYVRNKWRQFFRRRFGTIETTRDQ